MTSVWSKWLPNLLISVVSDNSISTTMKNECKKGSLFLCKLSWMFCEKLIKARYWKSYPSRDKWGNCKKMGKYSKNLCSVRFWSSSNFEREQNQKSQDYKSKLLQRKRDWNSNGALFSEKTALVVTSNSIGWMYVFSIPHFNWLFQWTDQLLDQAGIKKASRLQRW